MPHPMTYFSPTFPHPNSTCKELDEETGYGYFGARYYDATLLTSWTAVDPMADKYPNISPYAYCAWNPMKLVDPDGREIIFTPQFAKVYGKRLTDCLSKITGLSLSIDASGRLTYEKDANGNAVSSCGSATARADLIEAIDIKNGDGTNYTIGVIDGDLCEGGQNSDQKSGLVKMYCGKMTKMDDASTNGMGMIFLHELRHAVTGEPSGLSAFLWLTCNIAWSCTLLFLPIWI